MASACSPQHNVPTHADPPPLLLTSQPTSAIPKPLIPVPDDSAFSINSSDMFSSNLGVLPLSQPHTATHQQRRSPPLPLNSSREELHYPPPHRLAATPICPPPILPTAAQSLFSYSDSEAPLPRPQLQMAGGGCGAGSGRRSLGGGHEGAGEESEKEEGEVGDSQGGQPECRVVVKIEQEDINFSSSFSGSGSGVNECIGTSYGFGSSNSSCSSTCSSSSSTYSSSSPISNHSSSSSTCPICSVDSISSGYHNYKDLPRMWRSELNKIIGDKMCCYFLHKSSASFFPTYAREALDRFRSKVLSRRFRFLNAMSCYFVDVAKCAAVSNREGRWEDQPVYWENKFELRPIVTFLYSIRCLGEPVRNEVNEDDPYEVWRKMDITQSAIDRFNLFMDKGDILCRHACELLLLSAPPHLFKSAPTATTSAYDTQPLPTASPAAARGPSLPHRPPSQTYSSSYSSSSAPSSFSIPCSSSSPLLLDMTSASSPLRIPTNESRSLQEDPVVLSNIVTTYGSLRHALMESMAASHTPAFSSSTTVPITVTREATTATTAHCSPRDQRATPNTEYTPSHPHPEFLLPSSSASTGAPSACIASTHRPVVAPSPWAVSDCSEAAKSGHVGPMPNIWAECNDVNLTEDEEQEEEGSAGYVYDSLQREIIVTRQESVLTRRLNRPPPSSRPAQSTYEEAVEKVTDLLVSSVCPQCCNALENRYSLPPSSQPARNTPSPPTPEDTPEKRMPCAHGKRRNTEEVEPSLAQSRSLRYVARQSAPPQAISRGGERENGWGGQLRNSEEEEGGEEAVDIRGSESDRDAGRAEEEAMEGRRVRRIGRGNGMVSPGNVGRLDGPLSLYSGGTELPRVEWNDNNPDFPAEPIAQAVQISRPRVGRKRKAQREPEGGDNTGGGVAVASTSSSSSSTCTDVTRLGSSSVSPAASFTVEEKAGQEADYVSAQDEEEKEDEIEVYTDVPRVEDHARRRRSKRHRPVIRAAAVPEVACPPPLRRTISVSTTQTAGSSGGGSDGNRSPQRGVSKVKVTLPVVSPEHFKRPGASNKWPYFWVSGCACHPYAFIHVCYILISYAVGVGSS
eukprot:GHVQ01016675.1.p1 GENE.GHVQ01016675.1~~GHVQ01016675.1.p1  ORF type:complete len:1080 (+),score=243.52 GHVQ01016675.1:749-3988(+)